MRRLLLLGTIAGAMAAGTMAQPALAQSKTSVNQKTLSALQAMKGLNVIVLGDWNAGHEVEGKAWAGGNVNGNAFQVGIGDKTGAVDQSSGSSAYSTLTVSGNLNTSVKVMNGTTRNGNVATYNGSGSGSYGARIGGNAASEVIVQGDGSDPVGNGTVTIGGNASKLSLNTAGARVTVNRTLGDSNFNGSGMTVKAKDYTGNVNGLSGGTTVTISGASPSQNSPPSGWRFNASGQTLDAPTSADLQNESATLLANLLDARSTLSGLTTTSTTTRVSAGGNSTIYDLLFTAGTPAKGYNVFSITTADLFGARNIGFDLKGSTLPAIINVTGFGDGTYTFANNAGVNGYSSAIWNSSLSSQLLWNFGDATANSTLNVTNAFYGSILNPLGKVTNSTPIEGSLVAGVFNQNGEVHLGTFDASSAGDGNLTALSTTAAVPEPATWAMMVLGFGAVGGMIRRQRRQGATALAA